MAQLKKVISRLPSQSTNVALLLAFTFAATIGLRLESLANKNTLSHDEAITYLSATCHQGDYSQYVFDGKPVLASTWQNMLQLDKKLCFGQISSDLGRHDIHPPLYFWLLHAWSILVGVAAWTGPSLNLLIAILSTSVLYRLALYLLHSRSEAVLVTFSYGLNHAVIALSGLARQYDLLILISLLLIWNTVRSARSGFSRWRELLAFLLLAALGGLTHYHFVLPISACVLHLFVKLRSGQLQRFFVASGALAAGYVSSFIIHPYFFSSVETEFGFLGALDFSVESLLFRLVKIAASFGSFYYVIILVLIVAAGYLIQRKRDPLELENAIASIEWSGTETLFYASWIGGGITILYLVSITPLHQMSSKYFAMAWPFLSFVPIFVLRLVRQRPTVKLYLYLFPLVLAVVTPVQNTLASEGEPPSAAVLGVTRALLIDNTARGIFPRIIWHVPANSKVIAASQSDLLETPEVWLKLLGDEFVYVSEVSYGSTLEGQASMVELLEARNYEVTSVEGTVADAGTLFEVRHPKLSH